MVREASGEDSFLLADLPPTKQQIRLALGTVIFLLVVFIALTPFANIHLTQLGPFIAVTLTIVMISDLITSALLFSQFFVAGRTALFVLALSYLFTGLMVFPLMLIFPGAFSPTGLFRAGLQSAIYYQFVYRFSTPLCVSAYALLGDARSPRLAGRSPLAVLTWSVAIVIVIVCGVTWFTTTQDHLLPPIYIDPARASRPGLLVMNAFLLSALAVAVALLWARRRSVLDGWLMVMCCTWFLFNTMSGLIITDRFTVGWYGARGFEVIATMMVLFLLLSETTALYAKLARSVIRERRAREVQQFAMDATAAAIAHEITQPLAAIAIRGSAGLRWMARPDLDEARACIEDMISEAHRASDVIDGIRSLFKREIRGREWLDVNTVIRGVLTTVNDDLRAARISVSTELREQLPQLLASRAQLEEVLLNLIRNAIEAMHAVTDRARLLRITSFLHERSTVLITVEDNGTGIESKHAERVFDPFFTTKSEGTGIGLAVCRAIIDSHGGSLQASANSPYGTIFHVALPSGQS